MAIPHQIIGKQYVSIGNGGTNDSDLIKGNVVAVGRMGGGKADAVVTLITQLMSAKY